MFNLKKAAEFDTSLPYPKQLEDKRKEFKQKEPDEGTTERQLEARAHKDKDTSVPFNKQLEAARTGTSTAVTEKGLNEAPKLYNDKRDDRTHNTKVTAPNLVAEAYHQEKLKAFQKAQKEQSRDTEFWDKAVGSQMLGEKTKIVSNNQKSQLQNKEERFKGLKPDLEKVKKYDDMVTASLKQADAMQFQIFANAASESRNINVDEVQQIFDINSGKARLLAQYEEVMSKVAQSLGGQPSPFEVSKSITDIPVDGASNEPSQGTYTIRPTSDGYGLYIKSNDGKEELAETLPTVEEAHDYADKSPEFDGLDYIKDPALEFDTNQLSPSV